MRTGAATTITISAVLGAGALGVTAWNFFAETSHSEYAAGMSHGATILASPSTGDVDLWVRRSGLTPKTLSACGMSSGQVSARIGDARSQVVSRYGQIVENQQSLDTATANAQRLRRLVASGAATEQDKTDLATAETTLTTARASLQTELDAIFDAATTGLATDMISKMRRSHTNRSRWGLPAQYCVIDRTDTQWVDLRDAVAGKQIKDRTGRTQDQALIDALATADAHSDVSTAKSNLDSTLSEVTSAFDTAVAGL